jgi:hypothetical protein
MRKRRLRKPVPLPLMMMELALASWETIGRRGAMIARGKWLASRVFPDGSVGRYTISGLALSIPTGSRLDCGSGSLAPTGHCKCSPFAAQVTWVAEFGSSGADAKRVGSCQIRWPTTGIGNDLRIGRNQRRPLGFPPFT